MEKSFRPIGYLHTIGQLREAIRIYPCNIPFGFRNQPIQQLVETKDGDQTFVSFQEPALVHYPDTWTTEDLPDSEIMKRQQEGTRLGACKYVVNPLSLDLGKVTCLDCLRELVKRKDPGCYFHFDCWSRPEPGENTSALQSKIIKAFSAEDAKAIFESRFPELGYDEPFQ